MSVVYVVVEAEEASVLKSEIKDASSIYGVRVACLQEILLANELKTCYDTKERAMNRSITTSPTLACYLPPQSSFSVRT